MALVRPAAATEPAAARPPLPTATATRVDTPIELDGRLTDPSWNLARPIGRLRQVDPEENGPASLVTEVRIVYTADTLYFGIRCVEHPSVIVATQRQRDARLDVDDRIVIVLDPFFDHRNGFFFQVNPAGARADGQISDNPHFLNQDWDGIWDAAARITEDGWTVEIAIPFKTLRFEPHARLWGLNVERDIKSANETDRWAMPLHNSWIGNMAEAGHLTGLHDLRQGLGLDLRPYVSGGLDGVTGQRDVGLDVFKNVTPNLNASITLNTDFAQTEADNRQVNLTPFKLFFPEKRAFFLEGSGVFNLSGLGGGGGGGSPDLVPFFSRQIGIYSGGDTNQQVPILVGTKVTGRQGAYNIGVLDVQTRATPDGAVGAQNMLATRVSRNLFEQSSVGMIVTHGNPDGSGNTLVGGDAKFATSHVFGGQNLSLDLFALRTQDAALGADDAFGFRMNYPNDRWNANLNWKQIGVNFAPALGFVNRTGIRKANWGLGFQPRPSGTFVRQLFFEFRGNYITDLHNRVVDWRVFTSPLNLRTNSGDHVEFDVTPQYEYLTEEFEISDGVTLPVGAYRWLQWQVQLDTADKRRWQLHLNWGDGSFYNGTNRYLRASLTLKPSALLLLRLEASRNDITLQQGRFSTQLFSFRGDMNFSPNVSWATLVQYDNDSRELGVQSRFHWILQPGNDVFMVVNQGWLKRLDGIYQPNLDQVTAKLQYTLRF
jgi:Domain of unknown function (DUF5916)